jgi:SAM-dependent methyltransferase
MSVTFADHFSAAAAGYAAHRPRYPAALFAWLAAAAPARRHAWDCATGSGQAAVALAAHFAAVTATDASAAQLAHAAPHPRVAYAEARAEASGLAAGSADLVTVAQALHWFDRDAFYAEARRVLARGGVLAVWSYDDAEPGDAAVAAAFRAFVGPAIDPYWPRERGLVGLGYRELAFPFDEFAPPPLEMACDWTLAELLGYAGTWSAVAACRRATGRDPVPALGEALAPAWGDPARRVRVRWPLVVRAGRA